MIFVAYFCYVFKRRAPAHQGPSASTLSSSWGAFNPLISEPHAQRLKRRVKVITFLFASLAVVLGGQADVGCLVALKCFLNSKSMTVAKESKFRVYPNKFLFINKFSSNKFSINKFYKIGSSNFTETN